MKESTGISCPGCGLFGMKDEACTHMTCEKCQIEWCYFCKKTKQQLFGDRDAEFTEHNNNWPEDQTCCPTFLSWMYRRDDRWPKSDKECLDFFHRKLAISSLRKFLNKIS